MKNNNILKGIALVIVGIIVGLLFFAISTQGTRAPKSPDQNAGGIYNQVTQNFTNQGLKVGEQGSTLTLIKVNTCTLIGTDASQAASSTAAYDCAVTGVVSTDLVDASISTSTVASSFSTQFDIIGAKASSTNGFITVLVQNPGAAVPPSRLGVGSSTLYHIYRNQ